VIGTIAGSLRPPPKDELTTVEIRARRGAMAAMVAVSEVGPKYKARPHQRHLGHRTLPAQRLGPDPLPPAEARGRTAQVLQRRHARVRPGEVGFRTDATNVFTFRVEDKGQAIPGNSNGGHEFGAGLDEDERLQLLEYLKSL
jgi:hypothetical protein